MMVIWAALASFLSLVFTVYKLGPHWVRRMFGYDYLVDITLGLFTTVIFAMTATITGVLIAVVTNLMIGVGLWIGKNIHGYEKLEWHDGGLRWVRYPGKWITDITDGARAKTNNVVSLFKSSSRSTPVLRPASNVPAPLYVKPRSAKHGVI